SLKRSEFFSMGKASIVRMPVANGSSTTAFTCCSTPTTSPCRSSSQREIGAKNGSSYWIRTSRCLKKKSSSTNQETKSRSSHAPQRCSVVLISLDRKSTRLNSSHRTISYAVFCLKKKKKKHNTSQ